MADSLMNKKGNGNCSFVAEDAIFVSGTFYPRRGVLAGPLRTGTTVYDAFDVVNNVCRAVKVVDLKGQDTVMIDACKNEIQRLKELQQVDSVIKMFNYDYVEKDQKMYIVLEKGVTDLSKVFKSFNGAVNDADKLVRIKSYFIGMLKAVLPIHEKRYVHRDLKPENFLLVERLVNGIKKKVFVLIDFATTISVPIGQTSVIPASDIGTVGYMSPELSRIGFTRRTDLMLFGVDDKSDVWSLGIILYGLLAGKLPFDHIDDFSRLAHIASRHHNIDFSLVGKGELGAIVKECLKSESDERPTVSVLLQKLKVDELKILSAAQRRDEPAAQKNKMAGSLMNKKGNGKCQPH